MVFVFSFNKELLSNITQNLKKNVEDGVSNLPGTPTSARWIELPEQSRQQLQKQQQQPSDSLQVEIRGDHESIKQQMVDVFNFNKEVLDQWFDIIQKFKETAEIRGDNESIEQKDETWKPEWVISIKEKLDQASQDDVGGLWAKLSIYKVPHYLRDGDDKAYVPQIVSLGPYHHGKKRLRNMERHKWRSLHLILKRTSQDIKLYLDSVKELEEKARACYEGPIKMCSKEFVEMMVLDGCFVLELFRGVTGGFQRLGYPKNDPIFAVRGSMHSIQRDMIMLENQLPLFVLDLLLRLQLGEPEQSGRVAELALRFFDPLMPTDEPATRIDPNKLESSPDEDGLHCLDVFRKDLLRTGPKPAPRMWIKRWSNANRVADKRRQQLIHCVTELREAGIKFKKRKTDRLWDIEFKKGTLWIPRLLIHDGTRSLFLNLIAFEQCHLDCSNDISTYVIFMDNLINSPEDVAYLHYCGIIEHWLGSDAEVAELFNRLCQEVVFDINDSYLSSLSEQVNRYYNRRWNSWRASLMHNYFSNPWAIVSLAAGLLLLLLTFAQTFYGVYGYYWPRS